MQGYSYGEQPQSTSVVKLNTNESPYPPSPNIEREIKEFSIASLRRYPPALANQFRDAAAKLHGLTRDHILATRGGDELLRLLFTTFADPGDLVVMTNPTYSLYPVLANVQDARVMQIEMTEQYGLTSDFAQQANAAGAKMTFVVNPHAPSGNLTSAADIEKLADQLDSLLLVDEAYVDFIDPEQQYDCLHLARSRDDIIFLRTMSKGYGLAGLRFGYGVAHPDIIQPMLSKTRDSYNLDAISQIIATTALQDQDYANACWQRVRNSRKSLQQNLAERGFVCAPSEANFLLATVPVGNINAEALYLGLKDRDVLVRFFNVPGLSDKLRISIGSDEENAALLSAIDDLLK